jgi:hypothetical protein
MSDCVCYRRRKGTIKLCFWHAWQEQKIRDAVRRKYTSDRGGKDGR